MDKIMLFILGFMACTETIKILQDILGKEEYVRRFEEAWREPKETLPLSIITLIIVAIVSTAIIIK